MSRRAAVNSEAGEVNSIHGHNSTREVARETLENHRSDQAPFNESNHMPSQRSSVTVGPGPAPEEDLDGEPSRSNTIAAPLRETSVESDIFPDIQDLGRCEDKGDERGASGLPDDDLYGVTPPPTHREETLAAPPARMHTNTPPQQLSPYFSERAAARRATQRICETQEFERQCRRELASTGTNPTDVPEGQQSRSDQQQRAEPHRPGRSASTSKLFSTSRTLGPLFSRTSPKNV